MSLLVQVIALIRVTFAINILVFFFIKIKIIARLFENYECLLTPNCLRKITSNLFINELIFQIPSPKDVETKKR